MTAIFTSLWASFHCACCHRNMQVHFFLANVCLNANSTKLYIARFLKILANLHTALPEHLSATLKGARAPSGAVSHDHHQPTLWPHGLTPMLPTSSKNWYWSAKPVITLMIIIIIEIKVKEAKQKNAAFSVWFIMENIKLWKAVAQILWRCFIVKSRRVHFPPWWKYFIFWAL